MFCKSRNMFLLGCGIALGLAAPHAQAQSFTGQSVSATANIFGAGNPGNPTPNPGGGSGGAPAPNFQISPGTGRVLSFSSVSGLVSLSTSISTVPDGLTSGGNAPFGLSGNFTSFQGISGISLNRGSGFLIGVFLSGAIPADPAPASLGFTNIGTAGLIDTGFASLSPLLNQTFFVGDGLTGNGSGSMQLFAVPDGAERLFLGYADASGYNGAPGQYQDNTGSVTVSFQVTAPNSSVPEPGSLVMLAGTVVCGGSLFLRRRRKFCTPTASK